MDMADRAEERIKEAQVLLTRATKAEDLCRAQASEITDHRLKIKAFERSKTMIGNMTNVLRPISDRSGLGFNEFVKADEVSAPTQNESVPDRKSVV